MLFIHKEADLYPLISIYTGRVVDKNIEDYYLVVRSQNSGNQFLFERVKERLDIVFRSLNIKNYKQCYSILNDWVKFTELDAKEETYRTMMNTINMERRLNDKINAQFRYYNNYVDLALALYGDYCALGNLEQENGVAKIILSSKVISGHLKTLGEKLIKFVDKEFPRESDSLLGGAYQPLHRVSLWGNFKGTYKILPTEVIVPVLHDVMRSIAKSKEKDWNLKNMDSGKLKKEEMRHNVSTPNEDFYWASRARWTNVPIWAGPSYTVQSMLECAKKCDANVDEIQSLAYGIFAYWNQIYPHTATPVHRMFGVMTAAKEYNVPLEACDAESMYEQAIKFLTMV